MRTRKLNWIRCGCGCHGQTIGFANFNYWYEGRILYQGHGNIFGRQMGFYRSNKEMDEALIKDVVPRLAALKNEVEEALCLLDPAHNIKESHVSSAVVAEHNSC